MTSQVPNIKELSKNIRANKKPVHNDRAEYDAFVQRCIQEDYEHLLALTDSDELNEAISVGVTKGKSNCILPGSDQFYPREEVQTFEDEGEVQTLRVVVVPDEETYMFENDKNKEEPFRVSYKKIRHGEFDASKKTFNEKKLPGGKSSVTMLHEKIFSGYKRFKHMSAVPALITVPWEPSNQKHVTKTCVRIVWNMEKFSKEVLELNTQKSKKREMKPSSARTERPSAIQEPLPDHDDGWQTVTNGRNKK